MEKGVDHQEIIDRSNELKEQVTSLEKAIFTEKGKMDTTFKREQLQKYYCDVTKRNAKDIIEILIKEIRVYKDKIEIKLKTPLKKGPDNNPGSFYSTTVGNTIDKSNLVLRPTLNTQYYV